MIDESDRAEAAAIEATGIAVDVAPTLMRSHDDRRALARAALAAAGVYAAS
jgi:hypothetical protein